MLGDIILAGGDVLSYLNDNDGLEEQGEEAGYGDRRVQEERHSASFSGVWRHSASFSACAGAPEQPASSFSTSLARAEETRRRSGCSGAS